jgi:hypothetical protein
MLCIWCHLTMLLRTKHTLFDGQLVPIWTIRYVQRRQDHSIMKIGRHTLHLAILIPVSNLCNFQLFCWRSLWWHLEFILFHPFVSKETMQDTCRGNSSLFVLLGNPGVIWHHENGQCLQIKLDRSSVSSGIFPGETLELCPHLLY